MGNNQENPNGSPWMKQHLISRTDCMLNDTRTWLDLPMRDRCACGLRVGIRKYGEVIVPDGQHVEDVCVFKCSLPQGATEATRSTEVARGDKI